MDKIKAVGFDVDDTLIDGNSWIMLTNAQGCDEEYHWKNYIDAFEGRLDWKKAEDNLINHWKECGDPTKGNIDRIVGSWNLSRGAEEACEYLKSQGYQLFIISGSFDVNVKNIAKKLGIDDYYINAYFKYDNNNLLESVNYEFDQGELKVKQLREFCQKYNYLPNECAFVGDGDNDLKLFKITGRGCAVHSKSEKLKAVAWKIIDKLSDLKYIF